MGVVEEPQGRFMIYALGLVRLDETLDASAAS